MYVNLKTWNLDQEFEISNTSPPLKNQTHAKIWRRNVLFFHFSNLFLVEGLKFRRAFFPFSFLRTILTKSISLDRLFLHWSTPKFWLYPNNIGDEGLLCTKSAAQCVSIPSRNCKLLNKFIYIHTYKEHAKTNTDSIKYHS